jgi:hypothetical protein
MQTATLEQFRSLIEVLEAEHEIATPSDTIEVLDAISNTEHPNHKYYFDRMVDLAKTG